MTGLGLAGWLAGGSHVRASLLTLGIVLAPGSLLPEMGCPWPVGAAFAVRKRTPWAVVDGHDGRDRLSPRLAVESVAGQLGRSGLVRTGYGEGVDGDMVKVHRSLGGREGALRTWKSSPSEGGISPEGP